MNYYNEFDPFAAQWLRELIKAGHISPGEVDDRSIKEVQPNDLVGFKQCHFFAGIGVWSYALRQAGWPDDQEVWTGSCPCQPFSAAGKKGGFDDERHLWPDFYRLIKARKPITVFGEQVASKDGLTWFDLVSSDLENEKYTVGAVDSCAAGFGAPHIRQRFYWVADDPIIGRREERTNVGGIFKGDKSEGIAPRFKSSGGALALENSGSQSERRGLQRSSKSSKAHSFKSSSKFKRPSNFSISESLGNADNSGSQRRELSGATEKRIGSSQLIVGAPSPTNGFWNPSDWLPCIDGKTRPVESGTFPLAHGAPARVGRLRGYGNALVAPQAQAFVEAFMEIQGQ